MGSRYGTRLDLCPACNDRYLCAVLGGVAFGGASQGSVVAFGGARCGARPRGAGCVSGRPAEALRVERRLGVVWRVGVTCGFVSGAQGLSPTLRPLSISCVPVRISLPRIIYLSTLSPRPQSREREREKERGWERVRERERKIEGQGKGNRMSERARYREKER